MRLMVRVLRYRRAPTLISCRADPGLQMCTLRCLSLVFAAGAMCRLAARTPIHSQDSNFPTTPLETPRPARTEHTIAWPTTVAPVPVPVRRAAA